MEEIKKLYPLSFLPIAETYEWGGDRLHRIYEKQFIESDDQGNEKLLPKDAGVAESHELADLGYRDSQVRDGWLAGNTIGELMDMYLDRIVGESAFKSFGRQFPVGVKFISAEDRIPLLVHPNDEIAAERYDFLGKAKLWYVVDADEDSRIYLGFKEDADVSDFYQRSLSGDMDALLNVIRPKKGDWYMIEPGTVHSAEAVTLLEISEASPLDFCITGWGKTVSEVEFDSALSVVEALDFIDYKAYKPQLKNIGGGGDSPTEQLVKRPEFSISKIMLKDPLHVFAAKADSFSIYTCLEGEASIQVPDEHNRMESYVLSAGSTMLVPAEIEDFYLVPRQSGTILIETFLEDIETPDPYIDPDAEEKLPEDEED